MTQKSQNRSPNMSLPMRLLHWINKDKINWEHLCYNESPGIVPFVEQNMDRIDWTAKHYNALKHLKYPLTKEKRDQEFEHQKWITLSQTESDFAMEILEKNVDKISWYCLAHNSCDKAAQLWIDNQHRHVLVDRMWFASNQSAVAMDFLENHLDKVSWSDLSTNPCDGALRILTANQDKIDWDSLAHNPSATAVQLLKENFDKINWRELCWNEHDDALDLIEANLDKVCWQTLSYSESPRVLKLLAANQDKIWWNALSRNKSPLALALLLKNQDKINWHCVSDTDSFGAVQLLAENQDKIDWQELSANPFIFEYDYDAMRHYCSVFKDELLEERFHPDNLPKMSGWGFNITFDADSDVDY